MPALALALLAALGGAALVIDRLSLDNARSELRTAAEAAALAAARELANDDRLRPDYQPMALRRKAQFTAARIAAENVIAGEPLWLNTNADGDVRFGRLRTDRVTGEAIFVEAEGDDETTSVAVHARCTTDRHSAVRLPFRTFYAPTDADVVAVAEASLDFHVLGLRSMDDLPIPTLPLAILSQSAAHDDDAHKRPSLRKPHDKPNSQNKTQSVPNWTRDIEQRSGTDHYGFNAETGEVTDEADGIPEITLRTAARSQNPRTNAYVVDLTGNLTEDDLRRQIRDGWSASDLEPVGGELLFDRGSLTMPGLRGVDAGLLAQSLRKVVGQSRVVLLYERADSEARASVAALRVSGFVAGRVMSVREVSETECEIVFQPAVMATRSAVAASQQADADHCQNNKYVANLRLTN